MSFPQHLYKVSATQNFICLHWRVDEVLHPELLAVSSRTLQGMSDRRYLRERWAVELKPHPCPAPPRLSKFSITCKTRDPCSSTHRQLNATVSCSQPCDSKTTPLNHHRNNNNKDSAYRVAHQSYYHRQGDPRLSFLHELLHD